jgi:hypothetical protein
MYVYVRDEKIIHVRYCRNDDQTVKLWKDWTDMGHAPIIVRGEPNEQAR